MLKIDDKTVTLLAECGGGLLSLSYLYQGSSTLRYVGVLENIVMAHTDDPLYRPSINEPEIVAYEESLAMKRHDPVDPSGLRLPAAQFHENIHRLDRNVEVAHYQNGEPANYLSAHSYFQREADFILRGTRVAKGKLVPLERRDIQTMLQLQAIMPFKPN